MFQLFAQTRVLAIFCVPSGETTPVDPGETYYILVGGMRIRAGADVITVGAPN